MKTSSRHTRTADTTDAVDALMTALVHPYKAEVQALRTAILGADPSIKEGVKWSAPSFRTHEYFATVNLREKDGFSVILHLGAKVRAKDAPEVKVDDPAALLTWLAADRALVRFADASEFAARRAAFVQLIRSWITHVWVPSA